MNTTAIATRQSPWDCKFSGAGYGAQGVTARRRPETLWVCLRRATPVPIVESDCETCPDWEYRDPAEPALHRTAAIVEGITTGAAIPQQGAIRHRILAGAAVRALTIAIAMLLFGLGYTLLTRPLMVPVTIGIWLGAAVAVGLAIWGPLPDGRDRQG